MDRPITFLDLESERESLGPELERAVLECLRSGQYVLGPEVERLERDFAALCGVEHGIAVSSGTEALALALLAVGVRPGDHVLTTPFTFFASAATIAWIGAVPRFADVDPDSALLTPEGAAAALDERTRCVVPVHLYGQACDLAGFRALAEERGLALLEDAAQAHGARRGGAACGELGDAAAFSFYPTKNLGTAGEGGLVVTRRADVAERLRTLRDQGMTAKYHHEAVGTNGRLSALQAAVLNVKLPHLAGWNARRRELAARYDRAFAASSRVRPLVQAADAQSVYHQYTVRLEEGTDREALVEELRGRGVPTAVHYPRPVHLQPAARDWGYGPGDLPVAEALAARVLCLPVHPFLADEDVDRVASELLRALGD